MHFDPQFSDLAIIVKKRIDFIYMTKPFISAILKTSHFQSAVQNLSPETERMPLSRDTEFQITRETLNDVISSHNQLSSTFKTVWKSRHAFYPLHLILCSRPFVCKNCRPMQKVI